MNNRFYESDRERWNEIEKVKKKVAEDLHIPRGSRVLDVLVGEGDFSRAVAEASKRSYVVAGEILDSDLREAKYRIERDNLKERIGLLRMDVTRMAFKDHSFEYAVNFSGWEDLTAVSGEKSIDRFFSELIRVLVPDGTLALTFIPALEPKNEISRKDKELQEFMYKSRRRPKFLKEEHFLQMFKKHGVKLLRRNIFQTPKSRLRPSDSKRKIQWMCQNYKSFYGPDVEMRPYKEILREFGQFIEKRGIQERNSDFILLVGKKETDACPRI